MGEIPFEGEVVEVVISDVGRKGDGIARLESGVLVIVKGGQLHHRVRARVVKTSDTWCIAEAVNDAAGVGPPERLAGGRKEANRAYG